MQRIFRTLIMLTLGFIFICFALSVYSAIIYSIPLLLVEFILAMLSNGTNRRLTSKQRKMLKRAKELGFEDRVQRDFKQRS